jgi:hypothetical protein
VRLDVPAGKVEVIDWLREANFSAVVRQLALSWDEVDGRTN